MTLNHAWMLKGWLLAEHAPKEIMDAVEQVIGSLGAIRPVVSAVTVTQPIVVVTDDEQDRSQAERSPENPSTSGAEAEPTSCPENLPAKPAKKSRNWSPEKREEARQRMIAMRAIQDAKRQEQPGNSPAPSHRGAKRS